MPKVISQMAMFKQAHDRIAARNRLFVEIQQGPNPLTDEELRSLAIKYPERWACYAPKKPNRA